MVTKTEDNSSKLESISYICITHFLKLPKKGKPAPDQWTVLSAIVMETSTTYSVITMATGTKCVGEKQKSEFVVSDSHAEILCLRLFRLFLLKDMRQCLENEGDGMCLQNVEGAFRLKDNIRFHLYTSCVMCGDASIVTEDTNSGSNDEVSNSSPENSAINNPSKRSAPTTPTPNTKLPKLSPSTRTGAKSILHDSLSADSLSGRSWHVTRVLRSKPGRGPVSLSLSCSDKIMKRQFLGLQGGVLAKLLSDPVRFSSITIAGDFSEESVKRALFWRLPSNRLPQPRVFKARDEFPCSHSNVKSRGNKSHDESNSCSSSVLWLKTVSGSEHWVSVKGKLQGATKGCPPTKYKVPICRADMLEQVNIVNSLLLKSNSRDGEVDLKSKDLPNGSVLEQYQRLKMGSWYAEKKDELRRHFKGWDRKNNF